MAATIESAMPIERPIDGSTDCKPLLPIAVAMERQKMIRKGRRESLGTPDIGRFFNWLELKRSFACESIHLPKAGEQRRQDNESAAYMGSAAEL
ncbi:hypothetical protein [Bradyrhizobium forestalis]|uniref:hypothetical protein n=1 Tax=Bradyrhizobium forestalis TaxID=1419263 RepID=UPI001FDF541C|nr:hypothetical protein [Bradyrhizobium forestalis]